MGGKPSSGTPKDMRLAANKAMKGMTPPKGNGKSGSRGK